MFSNKSKLKLKPIKGSSIGMLSRAPEPAGNKLLAARATMQGDKTSFSASRAGRWDGARLHAIPALGGDGSWHWPQGGGEAELAKTPCPGLVLLLLVPSTLRASDGGQRLAGKSDGCGVRAKHMLLTR